MLLEDGSFASTYKYALLLSLADLAVEKADEVDATGALDVRSIAERCIQYYWPQVRPYPSVDGANEVLWQNHGQQASVVNQTIPI